MNNWIKGHRVELNKRAKVRVELLIRQNPDKTYWTVSELFSELQKEGFSSKQDMAISLKALGMMKRILSVKGRAARCYELKYSSAL